MNFKIATWNVNSLKVRLPQVIDWLIAYQPDVLALQETKLTDEFFPYAEIRAAGYESMFVGQKTYNGVAILTKKTVTDVITDIPELNDPQRRVLGVTLDGLRILNLYVPNGQSVDSDKYQYKLNWLAHLDRFLITELKKYPNMIILGDFNIAPADIDVHDPAAWAGQVLCSAPERAAFQSLLNVGFTDCFRALSPTEQVFSWWDYRVNAFKRKMGLRIDHVLVSQALMPLCERCYVDAVPRQHERPSDHAPVVAEFGLTFART